MGDDVNQIIHGPFSEVEDAGYPDSLSAIRERYKDTSLTIFKKWYHAATHKGSFLSFGSRRSSMVSNYGNTPMLIRRSFSSNGMAEYASEQQQFGSLRPKKHPALPSIAQDEAEDVLAGYVQVSSTDESTSNTIKRNEVQDQFPPRPPSDKSKKIIEELKNHKIFSQYDLPPSKKSSSELINQTDSPNNGNEFNVKNTGTKESLNEENKSRAMLFETHFDDCVETEMLNKNIPQNLVVSSRSSPMKVKVLPPIPSNTVMKHTTPFPRATLTDDALVSMRYSDRGLRHNSSKVSHSSPESKDVNTSTESSDGVFKRSSQRRSLRELPRRSPTPPRRSSRKLKSSKEKVGGLSDKSSDNKLREKAVVIAEKGAAPQLNPLTSTPNNKLPGALTVLPPLLAKRERDSAERELSSRFVKEANDDELLNTVLYIAEEGDPEPVLPSLGIGDLALDESVNKSFIVVHTDGDLNSIGLAPISPISNNSPSNDSIFYNNNKTLSINSISDSKKVPEPSFSASFAKHSKPPKSNKTSIITQTWSERAASKKLATKPIKNVILPHNSQASEKSNKNYLSSKALIRSYPLDESIPTKNGHSPSDSLSSSTRSLVNKSKLCVIM